MLFLKSTGECTIDLAVAYDTCGIIERFNKNKEAAEQAHLKAIRIFKRRLSNRHPRLLQLYENLGDTYAFFFEKDLAMEYYYKALEIGSMFLKDDSWKIISIKDKCNI